MPGYSDLSRDLGRKATTLLESLRILADHGLWVSRAIIADPRTTPERKKPDQAHLTGLSVQSK